MLPGEPREESIFSKSRHTSGCVRLAREAHTWADRRSRPLLSAPSLCTDLHTARHIARDHWALRAAENEGASPQICVKNEVDHANEKLRAGGAGQRLVAAQPIRLTLSMLRGAQARTDVLEVSSTTWYGRAGRLNVDVLTQHSIVVESSSQRLFAKLTCDPRGMARLRKNRLLPRPAGQRGGRSEARARRRPSSLIGLDVLRPKSQDLLFTSVFD